MKNLNRFIWQNYIESKSGQTAIKLFEELDSKIYKNYLFGYFLNSEQINDFVNELYYNSNYQDGEPKNQSIDTIIHGLIEMGIILTDEEGQYDQIMPDFAWYIDFIVPISSWLYLLNPKNFKPYFFIHNADLLTTIADGFGIVLPPMPLKRDKQARFEYYFAVCKVFSKFEQENGLNPAEMCAFLYDFCPKYFQSNTSRSELPPPTQVWFIGSNKVDFNFLDNFEDTAVHFWQGNLETKRGDILIMYCLSPRSHIHSIWRAEKDGIASPFFRWYSSIYISHGQKITPIPLDTLKNDVYFSNNKLVKKNFQGVNGYPLTVNDYARLLDLIAENGNDTSQLPHLFAPDYSRNLYLKNERDVEISLIEPFLKDLDEQKVWTRQLIVKMGRGEKVFPDYALLSNNKKGYEQANIVWEAKFHIQSNQELEMAFRQVWSYGLRLSADLLIIADKNAIWLYEKNAQGFDRNRYSKFYWKNLEITDEFNQIKKLIRGYFKK